MKLPSYTITQGRDRAPARAMLKAIGFTDEDLKKPIIGRHQNLAGDGQLSEGATPLARASKAKRFKRTAVSN